MTKVLVGALAGVAMLAAPVFSAASGIQQAQSDDAQQAAQAKSEERSDGQGAVASGEANGSAGSEGVSEDDAAQTLKQSAGDEGSRLRSQTQGEGSRLQVNGVRYAVEGTALTVTAPADGGTLDKATFRNQAKAVEPYVSHITVIRFEGGPIRLPADSSELFKDMSRLTSIENIVLLDTSHVTTMRSMFRNCVDLTSLDVSHFDTSHVTDMLDMFYYCLGLTNLDVSHFDTGSVTNMGGMFYNCDRLKYLDLSGFDGRNVTNMWCMFYGCSRLDNLDLSHFDAIHVTSLNHTFEGCQSLTKLDLRGFRHASEYYTYEDFFPGCEHLSQVIFPSELEFYYDAACHDVLPSTQDGYTGKWIQVAGPGLAGVDSSIPYSTYELTFRTHESDPNRGGMYVWQRRLTFAPSQSLPEGTSVQEHGQDSRKTVLGGSGTLADGTVVSSLKAPGSAFTLLDGHGKVSKDYRFAGWATTPNATTPTYRQGDAVDFSKAEGQVLYQVWEHVPAPGASTSSTVQHDSPVAPKPSGRVSSQGTSLVRAPAFGPVSQGAAALAGGDHALDGPRAVTHGGNGGYGRCAAASYYPGTVIPSAYVCGTQAADSRQSASMRPAPMSMLLLLLAAAIVVMLVFRHNEDDSIIARHRSIEMQE